MDESQWRRLVDLFGLLLEARDPGAVLAAECDPVIRSAAIDLWRHHLSAERENYLADGLEFDVMPMFQPGQVLLGRFRIERILGSGGMGEVYLAWDDRLEARVAIKTITRLLATSPSIRRRFVAEVQNARRVTHSNICRIHELFEEGETVFFSMEYVEGRLLSDWLDGRRGRKHARSIALQMARGLHAAHGLGVVHGDFKPANVILRQAAGAEEMPRAVIMDFGLARATDRIGPSGGEELSLQAGTAEYMAPEMRAGRPPTITADIYALGKVGRLLLPGERIWADCTCEDARDRLSTLDPVIRRLDGSATRRKWLLSGMSALATATAYAIWMPRPAAIRVPVNSRVFVNGFLASAATEIPGARLVRSLLLTALRESAYLRPVADQEVNRALLKLHAAMLPVSGDALRELIRELKAPFWIEGELREGAGRFALDLRLLAENGQALVTATSFHDAPTAVALAESAAYWVRKNAGESDRSLEMNSAAIASYTSRIPEALQRYYDALDCYTRGDMVQAIPLAREAVRLDASFAQAHHLLGLTLNSELRYDEGFREIERAMELAEKLPVRERIEIETNYYRATRDPIRMVESARRGVALRPDEARNHAVLARALIESGKPVDALEPSRKALDLIPNDWMYVMLLENALSQAGRPDEALDDFEHRPQPETQPWIYNSAGHAWMAKGNYEAAYEAYLKEPAQPEKAANLQAARILQGHFEEAERTMLIEHAAAIERAAAANLGSGPENELQARGRMAMETFESDQFLCGLYHVLGHPGRALPYLQEMTGMPAYPSSAPNLACAASWAHRLLDDGSLAQIAESASLVAARWENALTRSVARHAEALKEWRKGALDKAERLLLEATGAASNLWALFDLAELYTRAARWQAAENCWNEFEALRGRIFVQRWFPGIVVLGWMYRALAAHGRSDQASVARYAQRVIDHWGASNPEVAAVVAARTVLAVSGSH